MPRTDKTPCHRSLGSIAQIQPGYLARTRVNATPTGTHGLLQWNDVSADGTIQWENVVRFQPERNPELYEVGQGDVLVLARGQDHRAFLIGECPGDTLASSVFYIIRARTDLVSSRYLAWWLNLSEVQAEIDAVSRGTGIGYIRKQSLANIAVIVPPRKLQVQIEAVTLLQKKHESLRSRLNLSQKKLVDAVCRNAAAHEVGAIQ